MARSYKYVVFWGVGLLTLGLTAWGLSESGLSSQLLTQVRPGDGLGACYSNSNGPNTCEDGISLSGCTHAPRFWSVDAFLNREARDSMWVGGRNCDVDHTRFVSGHGESIVANAPAGYTAYQSCKEGELAAATERACPEGIEQYLIRPAIIAYQGWTVHEALKDLGLRVPEPVVEPGQSPNALYRGKCGAVLLCRGPTDKTAEVLPPVDVQPELKLEFQPQPLFVATVNPPDSLQVKQSPCYPEQVFDFGRPLPCPALPAQDQPGPAVGSPPEIFVSVPELAAIPEPSFLCRFANTWWVRLVTRITPLDCAVSLAVPEPSVAPAPPITPLPTPVVKAPQSIWCPEEATSSPEHLWGAYCCRERSLNLIGSGTCNVGYAGNPTRAICESTLPNQDLSTKMTTFGWSTWTCSWAKDDAIARAQGTIDVIKAKCPSGKTTVDCELADCSRNITLAAHAQVECKVTCDFTPRCNS